MGWITKQDEFTRIDYEISRTHEQGRSAKGGPPLYVARGFWYNYFRKDLFMSEFQENAPLSPEVPNDEYIESLLAEVKINKDTRKIFLKLITDPNNMFISSDRLWVVRQAQRIINAPNKEMARLLKLQLV